MPSDGRTQRADLDFEGGGVEGIGLAAAYSALAGQGWKPVNVAGGPAGAITAARVAAGYTTDEPEREVLELGLRQFGKTSALSMSVRHVNPETSRRHTIVDGGVRSDSPARLFDEAAGRREEIAADLDAAAPAGVAR